MWTSSIMQKFLLHLELIIKEAMHKFIVYFFEIRKSVIHTRFFIIEWRKFPLAYILLVK